MNNRVRLSAIFVIVLSGVGASAQRAPKHAPDFTITILPTKQSYLSSEPVMIHVVEKNISKHEINISRPMNPGDWYDLHVLYNGTPAPFTKAYRRGLNLPGDAIHIDRPMVLDNPMVFPLTKPGKTETFDFELGKFVDMSRPGDYEVTFSRGDIISNTVHITISRDVSKQ